MNTKFFISDKPVFVLIFALVSVRFLWPGESSFINDEPRLLQMAADLNNSGKLYSLGLMGSKGVQYGPVPVWYYRLLLSLTHDILLVSLLNTLFITALTFAGALKLVREVKALGSGILCLVFLSPFLWFYSRNMWDNSLNIPVVIAGFAWYLSFHRKRDSLSLFITFFTITVSLQIHLMAIPFAASILLHLSIFNRKWVLDNLVKFLVLAALTSLFIFPYLKYLLSAPETHSSVKPQLDSFIFPLLGGNLFSVLNFSYFLGDKWQFSLTGSVFINAAIFVITFFTSLSFPLVWAGIAGSLTHLWKKRKSADPLWHAAFISFSALVVHVLLCLFKGLKTHPHYYNGVWVYSLFFLGVGLNLFSNSRFLMYVSRGYISSLIISLALIISCIHINRGSRSLHYGHSLGDLISAAKILNEYPEETFVYPTTFHTKYFPRGIIELKKFYPYIGAYKEAGGIVLRYKHPENLNDASLVVEVR